MRIIKKVYPYLLRGVKIDQANQAWAIDITYIPLAKGYVYLVAIMDWASRKVLSWRLSNTMDTSFCLDALEEAIERFGCPKIINTDQDSQFTSEAFTSEAPPAERVASGRPLKGGEQQSISFVAFSIVMLPSTAETAEKGV